jgi:pilus assembly protein CpaB
MRRKRPRASTALFVLSLVLATTAAAGLRGHLAGLEARASTPADAVPVVVAARPLPRGAPLLAEDLRTTPIPERYAPPGALGSIEEATGGVLVTDLAEGEPLTPTRLARAGPVASQVPVGLRAMPLTISLPPGSVVPGDRVDVLAVTPGAPIAETVAVGLEVLLVLRDEAPEGIGERVTTLVLAVGPDTAVRLARARAFSDLTAVIAPATGSRPLGGVVDTVG